MSVKNILPNIDDLITFRNTFLGFLNVQNGNDFVYKVRVANVSTQ